MSHETFITLFHSKAHWEFEVFLMVVFDGIILGILWPQFKKILEHVDKHK